MTTTELSDTTAIVVGASRGLGRGIATALAEGGSRVLAVSRTGAALAELASGVETIVPVPVFSRR